MTNEQKVLGVNEGAVLQLLANKVSALLPAGMVVSLMIENGAAWVELVDNCWRPIPLPDHADRGLLEQLNDAVCTARGWPDAQRSSS